MSLVIKYHMIRIFLNGWREFKQEFDLTRKEPFNTYDWLEFPKIQNEYLLIKDILSKNPEYDIFLEQMPSHHTKYTWERLYKSYQYAIHGWDTWVQQLKTYYAQLYYMKRQISRYHLKSMMYSTMVPPYQQTELEPISNILKGCILIQNNECIEINSHKELFSILEPLSMELLDIHNQHIRLEESGRILTHRGAQCREQPPEQKVSGENVGSCLQHSVS